MHLEESPKDVTISSTNFIMIFDKKKGHIASLNFMGSKLINVGPQLNVWRAPTENDAAGMAHEWRNFGLDRVVHETERLEVDRIGPQIVCIHVKSNVRAPDVEEGFHCLYSYTIYGSGDIIIDADIAQSDKLPPLPRIGLNLCIPGDYNTFTWYGRGHHENRCEREEGGRSMFDIDLQSQVRC